MSYEVEVTPKFEEGLDQPSAEKRKRVKNKLEEFIIQLNEYRLDPKHHSSTRFNAEQSTWRLRIGDQRAFFDIHEDAVKFTALLPREDVYRY